MEDDLLPQIERAIGRLTLAHGRAELQMTLVAWLLIDSPSPTQNFAVTGTLQTGQLCALVGRLAESAHEDVRDDIRRAAKRLARLSEDRNRFVHAARFLDDVFHVRALLTAVTTGGEPPASLDLDAVDTLTERLHALINEIDSLIGRMRQPS